MTLGEVLEEAKNGQMWPCCEAQQATHKDPTSNSFDLAPILGRFSI